MFGKKPYVVKVYSSQSPKKLASIFEKDAKRMVRDGYIVGHINDEHVGFLGITTEVIRTVTYQRVI